MAQFFDCLGFGGSTDTATLEALISENVPKNERARFVLVLSR